MASEELIRLKEHLVSLEAFVGSRAYTGFIAARRAEIEDRKAMILLFDMVDLKSVFQQCATRGELECLGDMLETFPKAMEELKDRIADLEDEEMVLQGESLGEV